MDDLTKTVSKRVGTWLSPVRRLRIDTRGTSMLTSALVFPLVIVLIAGIYQMYLFMSQKQALHEGVMDAARYISENARYWAVDPGGESNVGGDLLPGDYYEYQARRIIESRLRDVVFYSPQQITDTLTVKVEEPLLAFHPDRSQDPYEEGWIEDLCYYQANQPDEYRYHKNIRFRVWAQFKVPLWQVRLPYWGSFDVTISDRAIGYVQCPRWRGKREADNYDKSKLIGAEGPYRIFRAGVSTPVVVPTATAAPPTAVVPPTVTSAAPTVTPITP